MQEPISCIPKIALILACNAYLYSTMEKTGSLLKG
jgi:hypothetical protein